MIQKYESKWTWPTVRYKAKTTTPQIPMQTTNKKQAS